MEAEDPPTVISLFTGAMGLDLGFEMEGFDIRVALDNNKDVIATIKKNRPDIPIIRDSIFNVRTSEILKKAKFKVGEATVVTGGPPCQPFSTAGRRKSVEEEKGQLVYQFLRVVRESKPKFFVFENVAGLISAARKHISFYDRVKKKKEDLAPKERLGSAFERVLEEFEKIRTLDGNYYRINWDVVNSADFGVPQKRRRFILLGSRDGKKIPLPTSTHGSPESMDVVLGYKKPWVTLREALKDLDDPNPEYLPFPSWGKYMKYIPEGGYWRDLPKELHEEALGGAYDPTGKKNKGGRTGFYRRLSWDKPAPTLLTSPIFKGSVLAHPKENRALSVKEYARIQRFPDEWEFVDHIATKYRLIGEAVPIPLARAVAKQILKELESETSLKAARIRD
jgi:DNA (cytosine-5)-methyltransferase 1